jgi:hypothetical protein
MSGPTSTTGFPVAVAMLRRLRSPDRRGHEPRRTHIFEGLSVSNDAFDLSGMGVNEVETLYSRTLGQDQAEGERA